ncbi:MAG: YwbE family protein [Chlorobi bacterium]|nr:YwbE family protein [Chlorobiota bacterium]
MDTIKRKDIKIGQYVAIVLKRDQKSGEHSVGVVKRILTKSRDHPHGIKVMLEDGRVGRVQETMEDE